MALLNALYMIPLDSTVATVESISVKYSQVQPW